MAFEEFIKRFKKLSEVEKQQTVQTVPKLKGTKGFARLHFQVSLSFHKVFKVLEFFEKGNDDMISVIYIGCQNISNSVSLLKV